MRVAALANKRETMPSAVSKCFEPEDPGTFPLAERYAVAAYTVSLQALEARTLTDEDIFYNVTTGLPRAEREIAASAASRINGCVYCASVHTARATKESDRKDDVQRLLDEGVGADLGQPWSAIAHASAALTLTPSNFTGDHIDQLRESGLMTPISST